MSEDNLFKNIIVFILFSDLLSGSKSRFHSHPRLHNWTEGIAIFEDKPTTKPISFVERTIATAVQTSKRQTNRTTRRRRRQGKLLCVKRFNFQMSLTKFIFHSHQPLVNFGIQKKERAEKISMLMKEKGPIWKLDSNENGASANGTNGIKNGFKQVPKLNDVIGVSLKHVGAYKKLDNKKQVVALIDDVSAA